MPVVTHQTAQRDVVTASSRRRTRILAISACSLVIASVLAMVLVPTTADAATTKLPTAPVPTTVPAPVYPLAQFPVQGPCAFIDTFGAPRSGGRAHEGVDIIAKSGLLVYAVANGTLSKQYVDAPGSLAGNGWRLRQADGTYYFYAHFSAFAPGLTVGSTVVAGQVIGFIGATGNAGTPHLHFEMHPLGGPAINPTPSVKAVDACKVTTPVVVPGIVTPTPPGGVVTTPTTAPPVTPTTVRPVNPPTVVSTRTDVVVGGAGAFRSLGRWQFISPVVVLKSSTNNVVAGVTKHVAIAGVAGLNAQSTGVLVRVSAYAGAAGSLAVHPCTESGTGTTTMTVGPAATAYATASVRVTNGEICVTSSASAGVRVEVIGQLDANGIGAQPIQAVRAFDSRVTGRLAANTPVPVSLAALGLPATATAVEASFTVVGAAAPGVLSVAACDGVAWQAAFVASATTSLSGVIRVNAAGLCVTSSVAADVIIDATGYFAQGTPMLSPISALRRFDSRATGAQIGATPVTVMVAGFDDWSAATPTALVNITMIGGNTEGSVFAWPCGQPQPAAAVGVVRAKSVNTVSALVTLSGGTLCLASTQPMHVIVDAVALGN